MKVLTPWVISAGLVLAATAANAQVPEPYEIDRPPYSVASDFDGPYAAMPPERPVVRYGSRLLPPPEVYTIVRASGFSALGSPQQRGYVYTIAVIDRRGDDGRLVIDGRTGQIIRFMPAYRMGDTYGAVGPLPPGGNARGLPRPPRPIPSLASRTPSVPIPKPPPPHAGEVKPLTAKPAPPPAEPQQSAAAQAKPADAQAVPLAAAPAAPAAVEAKPAAPQIQPTQEMPKVQGLE
jgi:hypothetical protein